MQQQKYIWGLDIGVNSIGWAIIDPEAENAIIAGGVRIIPTPEATCADRRTKRQMRRQTQRRTMRRAAIMKLLQQHGMFPNVTQEALQAVYPNEELKEFFAINPYWARAEALQRPLSPWELGRVFYHLAQRRGFAFKRSFVEEKDKAMSDSKKAHKLGMYAIPETEELRGNQTLGAALYSYSQREPKPGDPVSLRRRYTKREWYEEEFKAISEAQHKYQPQVLSQELLDKLKRILFWQRPLKSQRHLIGRCSFEASQQRAPHANLYSEYVRFYEKLNTITIDDKPFTPEQRQLVIDKCCIIKKSKNMEAVAQELKIEVYRINHKPEASLPACEIVYQMRDIWGAKKWNTLTLAQQNKYLHLIRKSKTPEQLESLAKKWGLEDSAADKLKTLYTKLPKTYGNLSEQVLCAMLPYLQQKHLYHTALTLASLRKVFNQGGKPWREQDQEAIIQKSLTLLECGAAKRRPLEQLQIWLQNDHKLSAQAVQGLYHHSYEATGELLPRLTIELLADFRNPTVQRVMAEIRRLVNDLLLCYGHPKTIRLEFARELKQSKKAREQAEQKMRQEEQRNNEAKALLARYDQPITAANILRVRLWQETKQQCVYTADTGKNQIPLGTRHGELFDSGYWEIDHIVPRSLFPSNSLFNLTLCPRDINNQKRNQTPYQFFKDQPNRWDQIKACAERCFHPQKFKHFINEAAPQSQAGGSLLPDTAYLATEARKLLQHICPSVQTVKGGITALLRHHWKLDSLLVPKLPAPGLADERYYVAADLETRTLLKAALDPIRGIGKLAEQATQDEYKAWKKNYNDAVKRVKKELRNAPKQARILSGYVRKQEFYPDKNRDDHRHHLIDAIVVAYATPAYNAALNRLHGEGMAYADLLQEKHGINPPQSNFRDQVNAFLQTVLVSYYKKNKHYRANRARAPLHKETLYGKHIHPETRESGYHSRMMVLSKDMTKKKASKIIDPVIREVVQQWLALPAKERPGYPLDRQSHCIKRVRVQENLGTAIPLSEAYNRWVKPGSNYIAAIYQDVRGKWYEEVISLWEAVKRKKAQEAIVPISRQQTGAKIHFTLRQYDYFLLGLNREQLAKLKQINLAAPASADLALVHRHLYRVQAISSHYYEFDPHKNVVELERICIQSLNTFQSHNPVKVKLDRLGRIRSFQFLYE